MHEQFYKTDQASHLRQLAVGTKAVPDSDRANMWAITSGKGGVGKSVVALGIAMVMANEGRKVLLIDADENLGKLDILLGLQPAFRMADVMGGKTDISRAVVKPFENLLFLAGTSAVPNHPVVSYSDREYLFNEIHQSDLDVTDIIIDTGAGVNESVLDYTALADNVIVVSNSEPTTIVDAYAVIKMTSLKKNGSSFQIIMNGSGSPLENDEAAEKLKIALWHFLHLNVNYAGFVPFDENVPRSVKQQIPLIRFNNISPASLCLQAISRRLLNEQFHIQEQTRTVYA